MEVWKGQIKSPRGLITRVDMKNRSAKVLVEGGRPAATLLRTPLATGPTAGTDGYTSRPGAYTNAKYFRWSMPELPSCPNLTLTLPSCPALAAQSTSLGWHRAPWAHRLRHPG